MQKRILAIAAIRDAITFIAGDDLAVLRQTAPCPQTVFYLDPPYTAAGKRAGRRLYTHSQLDHEALFDLTRSLTGDFLMTYDDTEEVRDLARQCHLDMKIVAMKTTHHAAMNELLIGRNLDWARASCQKATQSVPVVSAPASA